MCGLDDADAFMPVLPGKHTNRPRPKPACVGDFMFSSTKSSASGSRGGSRYRALMPDDLTLDVDEEDGVAPDSLVEETLAVDWRL